MLVEVLDEWQSEFQMNGRWIFGRNVVGVSDNVETGSTF